MIFMLFLQQSKGSSLQHNSLATALQSVPEIYDLAGKIIVKLQR